MRRWLAVLLVAIPALAGATMSMSCVNQPLFVCSAAPVLGSLPTGAGVASAATASTLASRDSNANLSADNFLPGYTTTATAAGTTTLTNDSTYLQFFTGSTTQTVQLPGASTVLGQTFVVVNASTGAVTVQSSGAQTILTMVANSQATFTNVSAGGTVAASWQAEYTGFPSVTGTGSVARATSPTLVTPALGTPTSGVLSGCTGLSLTTGVTGILPPANGGNGANNTATSGRYPKGDGTNFVTSSASAVEAATTDTLTNKTLDVEGTGNAITTVSKIWIPAASCQNTTAALNWDTPTTNAPAAACVTGTNTQKGVADFNQTIDQSMQTTLMLPSDWTGNIDATVKWLTTATSGSVAWCVQLICVADAETDDPAFPAQATGTCATDVAKGTTNQTNDVTLTSLTLGTGSPGTCAAGELMHIRLSRDPDETSTRTDTVAADARLIGIELTLRRNQ